MLIGNPVVWVLKLFAHFLLKNNCLSVRIQLRISISGPLVEFKNIVFLVKIN